MKNLILSLLALIMLMSCSGEENNHYYVAPSLIKYDTIICPECNGMRKMKIPKHIRDEYMEGGYHPVKVYLWCELCNGTGCIKMPDKKKYAKKDN